MKAREYSHLLKDIWVMLEVEGLGRTHNVGRLDVLLAKPLFAICIMRHPRWVTLPGGILRPCVFFQSVSHSSTASIGLAIAVHLVEAIENA